MATTSISNSQVSIADMSVILGMFVLVTGTTSNAWKGLFQQDGQGFN
jgi:hypothetical protein